MPREDFEKLAVLWSKYADTDRYSFCRTNKEVNYHHAAASIRDNNTTFIMRHSKDDDINHGLILDIIPLDGCPDSKIKRLKQMFFAMAFSLFNAQRLPDNQGKFLRILSKILLSIFRSKNLRYFIWKYSEKQMTKYKIKDCKYITELVTGFRYMKNKYPKHIFEKAVYKEFEGYEMPVPVGYDTYLKMAFGDYMKLPPEEQRRPKHDTVYINLKESYKNLKVYIIALLKKTGKKMIEDVTVGQYSKVNIRDLQMKSLEILLYFKDFCEKHNLRFYLCYGSCLGAIRHRGFIPWDDDIDVLMFREDYEKLGELWNKYADTERYEYCRTNKDKSYETMITQIADNNTTFIKSNLADFDINHGIKLEIFPLDASPNSKLKRKMQIIWALAFVFLIDSRPHEQGQNC